MGKKSKERTAAEVDASQSTSAVYKHVLEGLSAVLIVGFIVSVMLNQVVFAAWGHNFLLLADSGDVLMSGLSLTLESLQALLFMSFFFGGVYIAFRHTLYRRLETPTFASKLLPVALGLGVTGALVGIFPKIFISIMADYDRMANLNGLQNVATAAFAYGTLSAALYVYGLRHIKVEGVRGLVVFFAGLSPAIVAIGYGVSTTVSLRQDVGYLESYTLVKGNIGDFCEDSNSAQVIWIGSSSTILRCSGPNDAVVAVKAFDRLILEPVEGPQAYCYRDGFLGITRCGLIGGE